jgi:ABC-type methionine transport system permease subunit
MRIFTIRQKTRVWALRLSRAASFCSATAIGVLIAVLLMLLAPNEALITHRSEANLACAAIIGSALALVLSLSIIPAQKAAEAFSPAILKIYAGDRALLFVFLLLSASSMTSILLGTGWTLGLSVRSRSPFNSYSSVYHSTG